MERDVLGYEGLYRVTDKGEVITLIGRYKNIKYLKQSSDRGGYRIVVLVKNGVLKTKTVHRLVAEAFMGKSKLCVNHIDGNKSNNRLENLEFVTHKENMAHATSNGLLVRNFEAIAIKKRKRVAMIKDGVVVKEFVSAHEAARQTGYSRGNISTGCRDGKRFYGYEWRYL